MKNVLINTQGMIFQTEREARDYYGVRFESAILEWIAIDEDGCIL